MIGRHSVILRPDSVRRVTPPTTITAKTSVDDRSSQRPTAGGGRIGEVSDDLFGVVCSTVAVTVVEENLCRRAEKRERTDTKELG